MPKHHEVTDPLDDWLWEKIKENEGRAFKTARGLPYTYSIKRNKDGEQLGEIVIDRREGKTITRSTILLAYKKAVELGSIVKGPKKLGVFGASYIYPVFLKIGVIAASCPQAGDEKEE